MAKGNAVIGQSGGPTSVINSSLAGVIQEAAKHDKIGGVFGMRFAIQGFMKGNLIDLSREAPEIIEGLKKTPSSALGSSRHKLTDDDFPLILETLKKYDIRYFFMIGGNDSMDTINRVVNYAGDNGWEMNGIGVPKTVDNDLFGTDHTPGYPSAARYTALSVMQEGVLARDMQKVDQYVIYQSIGRDSGWLTAAAAAGKRSEDDAPHLIYLPERPFERKKFVADVKDAYEKYGWVSIAVGEGLTDADGKPVSASETTDKFENVEFGAMGGVSVAMVLHQIIGEEFDGWRGEFEVTESLPMSAADRASLVDVDEAYRLGAEAVRLAASGKSGSMVALERQPGPDYVTTIGTVPMEEVAVKTKPMPDEFINEAGNGVTKAFLEYLRPLVGELPKYVRLKGIPAEV
ncbi:6-phosphofructokinase [candidate division KSB1 bacterium]